MGGSDRDFWDAVEVVVLILFIGEVSFVFVTSVVLKIVDGVELSIWEKEDVVPSIGNKVVVAASVDVTLFSISGVKCVMTVALVEFKNALFSGLPVNRNPVVDVVVNSVPKKYRDVDKIQNLYLN